MTKKTALVLVATVAFLCIGAIVFTQKINWPLGLILADLCGIIIVANLWIREIEKQA